MLPEFLTIREQLGKIANPLVNEALSISTLAGVTGLASGGMSIALASMSQHFLQQAHTGAHSERSAASSCGNGERWDGHVAAQWRSDHAAVCHWANS